MSERTQPLASSPRLAVAFAVVVTLVLLMLGFPLIRDWLLTQFNDSTRAWLSGNKSRLVAWVDWLRILFEVILALFISSQVFNDPLRAFFENSLSKLRANLTSKVEKSISDDNTRVKIRNALNEVFVFMYLPNGFRTLPSDIPILVAASRTLYSKVRYGIPYLFAQLLFLRILGAFSGKLHATAALVAFWGVLLMKVLKLYLESPIFKTL